MNVLILLGLLFVALVIIVPLIEKSNMRMSEQQMSKWGRWILPLVILVLVIQFIMQAF